MQCRVLHSHPSPTTGEEETAPLGHLSVNGPIYAQSQLEAFLFTSDTSTPEMEITSIDFSVLRQTLLAMWKQRDDATGRMRCRIDGTVFLLGVLPVNVAGIVWTIEFPLSTLMKEDSKEDTDSGTVHSSWWQGGGLSSLLSDSHLSALSDMLGQRSEEDGSHVFAVAKHINIVHLLPDTLDAFVVTSPGVRYELGAYEGEERGPMWGVLLQAFSVDLEDPHAFLQTNLIIRCSDIDRHTRQFSVDSSCSLAQPLASIQHQLEHGYIDVGATALSEPSAGRTLHDELSLLSPPSALVSSSKRDVRFLGHLIGKAFRFGMHLPPHTIRMVSTYAHFASYYFNYPLWALGGAGNILYHELAALANVEMDQCLHVTINGKGAEACVLLAGSGYSRAQANISYDNVEQVCIQNASVCC